MTKAGLALALALAGCGDYSTEDLRFLAALPQREDLRVAVPESAQAAATTAAKGAFGAHAPGDVCGGSSEIWGWAKPTSDELNVLVELLVGLVDTVRRVEPSWRDDDARVWGPFDDEKHPGREIAIGLRRSYPAELSGAPRHEYAFEARVKGDASFRTILYGTFDGGSAARGKGALVLLFEELHALEMNDDGTRGTLYVRYDRQADPVTIELVHDKSAVGSEAFVYEFKGHGGGGGGFQYVIRDASSNVLFIATGFDASGAGRAAIAYSQPGTPFVGWHECWDTGATLVYVNDPANYSCDEAVVGSCSCGAAAACPAVPESPFP